MESERGRRYLLYQWEQRERRGRNQTRGGRTLTAAGLVLLATAVVAVSLWSVALVRGDGLRLMVGLLAHTPAHAASPPSPRLITISGIIFADDVKQQEGGRSVPIGIAATLNCNGTSTVTDSDGGYSLRLKEAKTYQCDVAASADYALLAVTIYPTASGDLDVNFGPQTASAISNTNGSACAPSTGSSVILCPVIQPAPGALGGVVTSADTHQPVDGIQIQCWDPSGGTSADNNPFKYFGAQTDVHGAYTINGMPVDRYDCNAQGDWQLRGIGVGPQTPAQMNIAICQARCPDVRYHNGPVMHTYTAYLIFWLPPGYSYDALGTDGFERILSNYFQDVGGTSYYNIATQYWDFSGPIQNSVALGGVWNDTHPYPHKASQTDPLLDSDIQDEVNRVARARHWTVDMNHAFFVVTGFNAELCFDPSHDACSFGPEKTAFCGYHSYTSGSNAIYAEIVDNDYCSGSLDDDIYGGPNGDRMADTLADYMAHEQFESATDPLITAWYDTTEQDGEVGDKCFEDLGYVLLNHDHTYYLQAIWSDATNSCAFAR